MVNSDHTSGRATLLLAVFLVLLAVRPAAAQSRVIVGEPTLNVSAGDAVAQRGRLLVEAFASGLQNDGQCPNVITSFDIKERLAFEKLRQALGSGNDAMANRLAEDLASAVGADTVVALSVGAVGSTYVVNATAIVKDRVAARVTEVSPTADDLGSTADRAGAKLGRALGCKAPEPVLFEGTLTYEVTLERTEAKTNEVGDRLSSQTRSSRKDVIELRGVRPAAGKAEIDETAASRFETPTRLAQCAAPGGYRDLAVQSTQVMEARTVGSGPTEPTVELAVSGNDMAVTLQVSDAIPRTRKQTDTTSGVTCGKPFGPESTTSTTDAISTAVDGVSIEVRIPFARGQAIQTGSKRWPVEVNDLKGTATLTWKLTGKS